MPPTTQAKFELAVQKTVQWVRTHREQFWAIVGTVAGAFLLVFFMINRRQTENAEAWTQLGISQGYLLQGQNESAAKMLDQWDNRFKGSGADAYAKFLRADLLYRTSDYTGAARIYTQLAQTGKPEVMRPLALSAASSSEEMAGRLPEAQSLAQQFTERYPDHFLAASVMLSQARLAELTGNSGGASAIYDRFVVLYPQSPWTALARARLAVLSPAPPPAVPK